MSWKELLNLIVNLLEINKNLQKNFEMKLLFIFLVFLVLASADKLSEALKEASDALNSGQSALAVEKLDLVLELDPVDTLSLFKRAIVCISLGRYEKALKDLDSLLNLKPNHVQALVQRAKIYLLYGKLSEALENAQKSKELDSSAIDLEKEINEVLAKVNNLKNVGDKNQLLDLLSAIILKCPLAVEYRSTRAHIYLELGQSELAIVDLRYYH